VDHRIPKVGLVLSVVCTVLAILTFVILNQAFEGPNPVSAIRGEGYHLTATFDDTEALPTKQPVLVRGVPVGKTTEVAYNRDDATATVTFAISDDDLAGVYPDASVTIGERTLLGDPYLNLDPGTPGGAELESGAEVDSRPSVDFDEALDFLDAEGRRHLTSTLETLGDATRSPRSGADLGGTVEELARTIGELRRLTDALHGQEGPLAEIVSNTSVVLDELGSREDALRRIVGSGRATLEGLNTNTESLERGVAATPGVLDAGTEALGAARPLIAEARPLVREVRRAAPDLAPALADVGPLAGDTIETVKNISGLPTLRKLLRVVLLAGPAVPGLEDGVRNLVSLLRYAAPRANGIVSFFSNMASVTAHGDSDGAWARFGILFEPGQLLDRQTPSICRPEDDLPVNLGVCRNAYPQPDDALDNEPFEPGSYERLKPYKVPPPQGP
jgi:phospholipid/cholesterol/gamma-HCH transport system substrate-binding protein